MTTKDNEGQPIMAGDYVWAYPDGEPKHIARVIEICDGDILELVVCETGEEYNMAASGVVVTAAPAGDDASGGRERDYNPQAYHQDMRGPEGDDYQSDNPQCYHKDER